MWPFKPRNKAASGGRSRDKPRAAVRVEKLSGIRRTRADVSMRTSEAVYAAVSRIANTMASMPLHLYKGHELAQDHPLERLIGLAPSDSMTPFLFVQTMEVCRNTEGNAYALLVPGKLGQVTRLDILDPHRVRPQRHPLTREMWYVVRLDDGKDYPLPGWQLLVLRHPSANGEIGIRPIDVLAGTLDYDKQVKDLSLNQLDGVNQGIFLSLPNTAVGREGNQDVVERFLDAYERSGNRVVILEGGVTAQTFAQTPISAQVLDTERVMRNRVASVYNIPPRMLGDYTGSTGGNTEQQLAEFLQLTIIPIVSQWEQELNKKLLSEREYKDGYRFNFDTDALTRADTAAMAEKHQKAIRGGWMKPNDVRQREGLPPDPYGDELMIARDLLPLRINVEQPEMLLGKGGALPEAADAAGEGGQKA